MLKKLVGIVLLILVGIVSFFIGGRIGFESGFSYRTSLSAACDGAYKVMILRAIRKGKIDEAILLLESALDSNIVERAVSDKKPIFLFSRIGLTKDDTHLMRTIAKYRKEYPTQIPDTEARKLIEETLLKYK